MPARHYSKLDHILGQINKSINALGVRPTARRASPADAVVEGALDPAARRESARLMRVNHAGEIAAQALYEGQAFTARSPEVAQTLREAAAEERDHLAWCGQRLTELGARGSILNPVWYAGSFTLGAIAGTFGDGSSLGFIVETERQVETHLQEHIQRLPPADARSRLILEHMQIDEARHGAKAAALGGRALPSIVQKAMRLTSKLMTHGSYWL